VTFEVWHVTDHGEQMRRLGDGSGRQRDKAGRWRPVDPANPGPSPNNFLRDFGRAVREGDDDLDRPLRQLYADLDAGKTVTGRDADRLIADTEQSRRRYGTQVARRSPLLKLYDRAIADSASPAEAQRRAAREYAEQMWKDGLMEHEESAEAVAQAVHRRRQTPPPRRIDALYQVDENGEYQLIYDFAHRGRDQRRDQ